MRLTPLDIRKQEFPQRFRGYDTDEVDTFLDLIADDVEQVVNERNQLADRTAALEAQLAEFREIEKSLRNALVLAEKTSSEASETAQRRADALVREAEVRAQEIIGEGEGKSRTLLAEAENRRRALLMELEALESQRTYAISKFRSLIEDQRAVVEAHQAPRGGGPRADYGTAGGPRGDYATAGGPRVEFTPGGSQPSPARVVAMPAVPAADAPPAEG